MGNTNHKPTGRDANKWVFGKTDPITKYYTMGPDLGLPGQYGKAQLVTEKKNGRKCCAKVMSKRSFGPNMFAQFRQEIEFLKVLKHPNIVQGYEVFESLTTLWIVMEVCSGGELFERITKKHEGKGYSEKDAQKVLRQVASGIKYLHDHKIAHCDLKPDNLMFMDESDDSVVKIIDFGMARYTRFRKYEKKVVGTTLYMAPEVWQGKYSYHADVWSFGVIMFIMLFGFPPFHGARDEDIRAAVLRGFTPKTLPNYGAFFPQARPASDAAKDLIAKMLVTDQAKRLTIDEVLEHPWMTGDQASANPIDNVLKNIKSFRADASLKKAILFDMGNNMSEAELLEIEKTFRKVDKDGNGKVTVKELQQAMTSTGNSEKSAMEEISKLMQQVDLDGDGELSYEELVAASVNRQLLNKEERLWAKFQEIDKNGDGKLSIKEISQAFETDAEYATAMMKEVDANGDGTVDYEEFLQMWMSKEQLRNQDLRKTASTGK
eukprot:g58102.t1